jgi:uncharacterized membrane protein YccC
VSEENKHDVGSAFWRVVTHFDRSKIYPYQAFRNAVGVALPLIIGFAMGMPRGGLAAASGALYVSYSDGNDPYLLRGRRMLAAGLWCSLGVFFGAISAGNAVAAVAVATLWAFAAGLFVSLGTTAASLGVISLVSLVIYEAQSLSPKQAAIAGLLTLVGGILQTILSIALWPVQRYGPERRVLSAFYRELSHIAEMPLQATAAPPASAPGTKAQEAFAGLGPDRSLESLRYRSLLNQAERMRLSVLMLTRLRLRMFRENSLHAGLEVLDRYLALAGRALELLSDALLLEKIPPELVSRVRELDDLSREMRESAADATASFVNATAQEARFQMDALSGQLRATMDLVSRVTPVGELSYAKREAGQPLWPRYSGMLATLRANLNFGSAAFRHAVRLSVCVAAGEVLSRSIGLRRSYWLVMTVVLVLKPDFSSTFSRGVLRIVGTLAGLVLATALFQLHPTNEVVLVCLIFILSFVLSWIGPANYGIFTVAISALIVLFFAVNGIAPQDVIRPRMINTIAGGCIALLAYWAWPTREQSHISEIIAKLLEAYRDYFHAVVEDKFHPETLEAREVDRARLQSRRARSNLEAAIERLLSDPGTNQEQVSRLNAMLASSHRFAHAAMAIDAYDYRAAKTPGRPAFLIFAEQVESVLDLLALSLRGERIAAKDWPDLRESYHRLVQEGDGQTERYALTNVEADRITNSLNTLRDQLLAWTSRPSS